jgi:hypothetical protein
LSSIGCGNVDFELPLTGTHEPVPLVPDHVHGHHGGEPAGHQHGGAGRTQVTPERGEAEEGQQQAGHDEGGVEAGHDQQPAARGDAQHRPPPDEAPPDDDGDDQREGQDHRARLQPVGEAPEGPVEGDVGHAGEAVAPLIAEGHPQRNQGERVQPDGQGGVRRRHRAVRPPDRPAEHDEGHRQQEETADHGDPDQHRPRQPEPPQHPGHAGQEELPQRVEAVGGTLAVERQPAGVAPHVGHPQVVEGVGRGVREEALRAREQEVDDRGGHQQPDRGDHRPRPSAAAIHGGVGVGLLRSPRLEDLRRHDGHRRRVPTPLSPSRSPRRWW